MRHTSGVFADFLGVTVPADEWHHGALPEMESVLDEVCCERIAPDYFKGPSGGHVKFGQRSGVVWVQATGQVLAELRAFKLLDDFLMSFGTRSHRVTRLDATLDLPHSTPPVLDRLYDAVKGGELRLSRKRVTVGQLSKLVAPSLYGGEDTGTLYVGQKTAEVCLKVYDKRQERLKFTGQDIGFDLTRYEVTVRGKMGPSLRDVFDPTAIFYHYMSPEILHAPLGVPAWVPYEGGYSIERGERLPYQVLKRRMESSSELQRLLTLASQCGDHGFELFVSQAQRAYRSIPSQAKGH